MSWLRRAKGPRRTRTDVSGPADEDEARSRSPEPDPSPIERTDTVGNPIVERRADARHAAPDAGPTRAEHRMLQFVSEGRVARTATGGAGGFWRIDGAFATGTKSMMLDWLLEQGFVRLGPKERVTFPVLLSERGSALVDGRG